MVKELGESGAVVQKFILELYGKEHQLYVDNWCTKQHYYIKVNSRQRFEQEHGHYLV